MQATLFTSPSPQTKVNMSETNPSIASWALGPHNIIHM